jgi:hypothetical protein
MLSGHPQPMETPCGSGAGIGAAFLFQGPETGQAPDLFRIAGLTGLIKYRAETSPLFFGPAAFWANHSGKLQHFPSIKSASQAICQAGLLALLIGTAGTPFRGVSRPVPGHSGTSPVLSRPVPVMISHPGSVPSDIGYRSRQGHQRQQVNPALAGKPFSWPRVCRLYAPNRRPCANPRYRLRR